LLFFIAMSVVSICFVFIVFNLNIYPLLCDLHTYTRMGLRDPHAARQKNRRRCVVVLCSTDSFEPGRAQRIWPARSVSPTPSPSSTASPLTKHYSLASFAQREHASSACCEAELVHTTGDSPGCLLHKRYPCTVVLAFYYDVFCV